MRSEIAEKIGVLSGDGFFKGKPYLSTIELLSKDDIIRQQLDPVSDRHYIYIYIIYIIIMTSLREQNSM